jgi:hypothetical protein
MAKVAGSEIQRWLQAVKPVKLIAVTSDAQRIVIKLKGGTLKWRLAEKAVLSFPKVVALEAYDGKDNLIHRMDLGQATKGQGEETAQVPRAFDKDNPSGWLDLMLKAQKLALEQQRDVLMSTMDVFTRVSKMQSDRLIGLETNFSKVLQLAQEATIARTEAQVLHAVASAPSEPTSDSMLFEFAKMWFAKHAAATATPTGQAADATSQTQAGTAAPKAEASAKPNGANGAKNGTSGVH